ncbi:cullin family protein [Cyclospora cayetanensis]|uniref:Cullin family protein n=1 Tax=Cyclospora cayetanensis TaxID=88456 RepID=A0A1D3CSF0_9EIME|nr:cullin family protein [Cyclospora cayetanensis]
MPAFTKSPPSGDLIRFNLSPDGGGELHLAFVVGTWKQLEEFLHAVFDQGTLRHRVALARRIETLVLDGWGPCLLSRVSAVISGALTAKVDAAARVIQTLAIKNDDDPLEGTSRAEYDSRANQILEEALNLWEYYCTTTHQIQQVCVHLDRCVAVEKAPFDSQQQQQQPQGLQGLCDKLLSGAFTGHDATLQQLTAALLHVTETERRQKKDPNPKHRSLTLMYIHLNRYFDLLEPSLIAASRQSFRAASEKLLGAPGTPESGEPPVGAPLSAYLSFAASALLRERRRLELTLHGASESLLMGIMQEELVRRHRETLANPAAIQLYLKLGDKENLQILYELFAVAEELPLLKKNALAAVRSQGELLLNTLKSASLNSGGKRFIADLLEMKQTHEAVFVDAFAANQDFLLGLKEAWESFLMAEGPVVTAIARLLSRHIDSIIRKAGAGQKSAPGDPPEGLPDEDPEVQIEKVIGLFALIAGKETFEQFYRLDLSRRLLLHGLANEDLEKTLVRRLRDECGPQYTSKIEAMIADIKLSETLMEKMKTDPVSGNALAAVGCSLHARVCAKGMWPAFGGVCAATLILSPPFSTLQEIFFEYYGRSASGRKLQMVPSMSTCEVTARISPPTKAAGASEGMPVDGSSSSAFAASQPSSSSRTSYILFTSQLQALCLLAFNAHHSLSLASLRNATGLTDEELMDELSGLCTASQTNILHKDIRDGEHVYSVNFNFYSPLKRIKVLQAKSQASPQEGEASGEPPPDADLTHQIDAGIVRILKRVSSMRHQELFGALAEALKRPVDAATLKKRLESLIDRDYIARDAADSQAYRYVA